MADDTPMMTVECCKCGHIETLPIGRREEVIHAIIHHTGHCLKCGSDNLSYRDLSSIGINSLAPDPRRKFIRGIRVV